MTYRPRRHCKRCGVRRSDTERISRRGNCTRCGLAELEANVRELASHAGPRWDAWRAAMLDAVAGLYGPPQSPGELEQLPDQLAQLVPDER